MNHKEVGKIWDENAGGWTKLVRAGCDIYRDHVNTPAFMEMLPEVKGLEGLDIGCGEGHNTRLVAQKGAKMTAVDISEVFIKQAKELERAEHLGIDYKIASAIELPFEDNSFDFAMATMSLMDIPETDKAIKQAWRVIRPGGFFQFSISHPCFFTPKMELIYDDNEQPDCIKCGQYYRELNGEIEEWIFSAAPEELKKTRAKFKVPRFTRTLSKWLNLLIDTGFVLERFAEPRPDDKKINKFPSLAWAQVFSFFLIIGCKKLRGCF